MRDLVFVKQEEGFYFYRKGSKEVIMTGPDQDGRQVVVKVRSLNDEPSKTQQHFKEEVDINKMVEKARRGIAPTYTGRRGVFSGDEIVGDGLDYQAAMNRVIEAREKFMELPAKVRVMFQNDPGQLEVFLSDPKNRDEAIQLGLIEKKVVVPDPTDRIVEAIEKGAKKPVKPPVED